MLTNINGHIKKYAISYTNLRETGCRQKRNIYSGISMLTNRQRLKTNTCSQFDPQNTYAHSYHPILKKSIFEKFSFDAQENPI